MKSLLVPVCFASAFAALSLLADDADLLAGKWSVKKTNPEGQSFTQTIEVMKNKFTFQILNADGQAAIYAEGDLKLEKLGPFNSAHFFNIRGGDSPSNLSEVNDEYNSIYVLDGDTWTVASGFDKDRGQKPSADSYHRLSAASEAGTLVIDEIEMLDTPQSATYFVCFDANVEGVKGRHYREGKGYDKNKITIPMGLQLAKVKAGQKCAFRVQLDDVDEDTCTDEMDNRSTGEFTVTDKGSQTYKPEANWQYIIRWHLK